MPEGHLYSERCPSIFSGVHFSAKRCGRSSKWKRPELRRQWLSCEVDRRDTGVCRGGTDFLSMSRYKFPTPFVRRTESSTKIPAMNSWEYRSFCNFFTVTNVIVSVPHGRRCRVNPPPGFPPKAPPWGHFQSPLRVPPDSKVLRNGRGVPHRAFTAPEKLL